MALSTLGKSCVCHSDGILPEWRSKVLRRFNPAAPVWPVSSTGLTGGMGGAASSSSVRHVVMCWPCTCTNMAIMITHYCPCCPRGYHSHKTHHQYCTCTIPSSGWVHFSVSLACYFLSWHSKCHKLKAVSFSHFTLCRSECGVSPCLLIVIQSDHIRSHTKSLLHLSWNRYQAESAPLSRRYHEASAIWVFDTSNL